MKPIRIAFYDAELRVVDFAVCTPENADRFLARSSRYKGWVAVERKEPCEIGLIFDESAEPGSRFKAPPGQTSSR